MNDFGRIVQKTKVASNRMKGGLQALKPINSISEYFKNELELYTPLAYFRFQIMYDEINLPNVSKEVTPSVTRAGIASGLIQKEIQDMTTMSAEGMQV